MVSTVIPRTGSSLGGTRVTIEGANFATGAMVALGGTAATGVVVNSPTAISAMTPSGMPGVADLTVTVAGRSAALPGAFTFTEPQSTNRPPILQGIDAQGTRRNEPSRFADLNEEILVTALITDAETSPDALIFEWTADQGTFSGTGRVLRWKAPEAGGTPRAATLKVTAIERFQIANDAGVPVNQEHRVEGSTVVQVHDSAKEVGTLVTRFLENFSRSSVPTSTVMQDFFPTCYGTATERDEVERNRRELIITSSFVGPPAVTVNFGAVCPFRDKPGDACSNSEVRWTSDVRAGGSESVAGFDHVAAVYRAEQWWLCDSQWEPRSSTGSGVFLKLLTGGR
jgi:hypothetical protein